MRLLNKLFKKEKKPKIESNFLNNEPKKELTYLDELKKKESIENDKMYNEDYYFSDEAKNKAHEIKRQQYDYLKNNPDDFVTRGVNLYNMLWEYSDRAPAEEIKIFELTGRGLYYDDQEQYEKAIEFYQEADNLTMKFLKDEIDKLVKENGEGDYLYTAKLRQRIRVCENKLFRNNVKKLEMKAKELEETNPKEAIEKYKELNEINPGLKKYDKRIFKMIEIEAKELEETDPQTAINKYKLLNILNPGLKKYDKRIEMLKRKIK